MNLNNINSCSQLTHEEGQREHKQSVVAVQNHQSRFPGEAELIWVLKDGQYLNGRKEEKNTLDKVSISHKTTVMEVMF